jgi:hypothetical protein
MNVIVHQTITEDFRAIFGGVPGEQAEVQASVCVRIKYRLPIIAPLCDVVGNTGNHNARATWHTSKVLGSGESSQI